MELPGALVDKSTKLRIFKKFDLDYSSDYIYILDLINHTLKLFEIQMISYENFVQFVPVD